MSLNRGEVNALNALGFRKLSFIPKHFSKITIDHKFDARIVEQWIEYNLNSRYAIRVIHKLDSNKKIISVTEVGMEDPGELVMLSIGCPELYKK